MTDLIVRARDFARDRHSGQTRKDVTRAPYFTHLEEVAALVTDHGGDEIAICAAWLHDTVEDCPPTSLEEIAGLFGTAVAGVVGEVSDDKSLPKMERKRLQILHAPAKSPRAARVKIADKTANVRAVGLAPPAHWDRTRRLAYLDWAEAVVNALPSCPAQAQVAFDAALADSRAILLG